jgi:hypothetical protein
MLSYTQLGGHRVLNSTYKLYGYVNIPHTFSSSLLTTKFLLAPLIRVISRCDYFFTVLISQLNVCQNFITNLLRAITKLSNKFPYIKLKDHYVKKSKLYLFPLAYYLLLFNAPLLYAENENCPKKAVHCVYSTSNNSSSKWIKVIMLPKNISMIVCMNNHDILSLEKDDIEQDGTLPGTILIWNFSQCFDKKCVESQPIGTDQFTLNFSNNSYHATPPTYTFTVISNYGETCTFPVGKSKVTLVFHSS